MVLGLLVLRGITCLMRSLSALMFGETTCMGHELSGHTASKFHLVPMIAFVFGRGRLVCCRCYSVCMDLICAHLQQLSSKPTLLYTSLVLR